MASVGRFGFGLAFLVLLTCLHSLYAQTTLYCPSAQYYNTTTSQCEVCHASLSCSNSAGTTGSCDSGQPDARCLIIPGSLTEGVVRSEGNLFVGLGLEITDADIQPGPDMLQWVKITFYANAYVNGSDTIELPIVVGPNTITGTFDGIAGAMTLTAAAGGLGLTTDFIAALERLTVVDHRPEPLASRTLSLQASDGTTMSNIADITLGTIFLDDNPTSIQLNPPNMNVDLVYNAHIFTIEPPLAVAPTATIADGDGRLPNLVCDLIEAPFANPTPMTGEFLLFTTAGTGVSITRRHIGQFLLRYTMVGGANVSEYQTVLRTMHYENLQREVIGQVVRVVSCYAGSGATLGVANASIAINIIQAAPFQNWTNRVDFRLQRPDTCTPVFTDQYTILAGETDFLQRAQLTITLPPNNISCANDPTCMSDQTLVIFDSTDLRGVITGSGTNTLTIERGSGIIHGFITVAQMTTAWRRVYLCSLFSRTQVLDVRSNVWDFPTERQSDEVISTIEVFLSNNRPVIDLATSTCINQSLVNYLPVSETTGLIEVSALIDSLTISDPDAGDTLGLALTGFTDSVSGMGVRVEYRRNNESEWRNIAPGLGIPSPTVPLFRGMQFRVMPQPDFNKRDRQLEFTFVAFDNSSMISTSASLSVEERPYSAESKMCGAYIMYQNRRPVLSESQFLMPGLVEDPLAAEVPASQTGTGANPDNSLYRFMQIGANGFVKPEPTNLSDLLVFASDVDDMVLSLSVVAASADFGIWRVIYDGGNTADIDPATYTTHHTIIPRNSKIQFIPNAHSSGDATISFRAYDGAPVTGATEQLLPVNIDALDSVLSAEILIVTQTVLPLNDVPLIDLNGAANAGLNFTTTFTEESTTPVLLSNSLVLLDPDSATLDNASICWMGFLDVARGEKVQVSSANPNITISNPQPYGNGFMCIQINGKGTLMEYSTILSSATYINPADEPLGIGREIFFVGNDGRNRGGFSTRTTVTFQFVNDRPQIVFRNQTAPYDRLRNVSYYEGNPGQRLLDYAVVSDVDSVEMFNLVVTIFFKDKNYESVSVNHSQYGNGIIWASSSDRDEFRFLFSTPNDTSFVTELVQSLVYVNTKPEPTAGVRQLTVSVTDSGGQTSLLLTVNLDVIPVNDNAPVFSLPAYTACVPEGSRGHDLNVAVAATDADRFNQPSSTLTYNFDCPNMLVSLGSGSGSGDIMLSGPLEGTAPPVTGEGTISRLVCEIFNIDPLTGQITTCNETTCVVPRHVVKPRYELNVTVTDGLFTSRVSLTIKTLQVNRNAPVFSPLASSITIREGAVGVGQFFTVTATDADTMHPNNNLSLMLTDTDPLFQLTQVGNVGTITISNALDFETQCEHLVKVVAFDGFGQQPGCFFGGVMSGTGTFTVLVTNTNEFNPQFVPQDLAAYSITVDEESSGPLFDVNATDADQMCAMTTFNPLVFSLADESVFTIHPTTGVISAVARLDRDSGPVRHTVSITVTDSGSPPRSDSIILTVNLRNINDNDPVFTQPVYDVVAVENTPGVLLLTLVANDADTTSNSPAMTYSLAAGSPPEFQIMNFNELWVTGNLDYETGPREYNLTVVVTDNDVPSRSGTAVVRVMVSDANDQAPFITGLVNHTIPVGQRPLQILQGATIVDNDGPSHPIAGLNIALNGGDLVQRTSPVCDCTVGMFGSCTNAAAVDLLSSVARNAEGNVVVDGSSSFSVLPQVIPTNFIEGFVLAGCFQIAVGESQFGTVFEYADGFNFRLELTVEQSQFRLRFLDTSSALHSFTFGTGATGSLNDGAWHSFSIEVKYPTAMMHLDGNPLVTVPITGRRIQPAPHTVSQSASVGCGMAGICFKGHLRRLVLRAGVGNLLHYAAPVSPTAREVSGTILNFAASHAVILDSFSGAPPASATSFTVRVQFSFATADGRGTLISQGRDATWRFGFVASATGVFNVFYRTCSGAGVNRVRVDFAIPGVNFADGTTHTVLMQYSTLTISIYVDSLPSQSRTLTQALCFANDANVVSDANTYFLGGHARGDGTLFLPFTGTITSALVREGLISPVDFQCLNQGCGGNCRCGGRCDNLPNCVSSTLSQRCRFDFLKHAQCDVRAAVDVLALSGALAGCSAKEVTLTLQSAVISLPWTGFGLPMHFTTFSVSFWFRFTGATTGEVLVIPGAFAVRVASNALEVTFFRPTNPMVLTFGHSTALNNDGLYHAAITVDNSSARAYINGNPTSNPVQSLPVDRMTAVTGNWYIGSWPSSSFPSFQGVIRALTVTTAVIGPSQVLCLESCGQFISIDPPSNPIVDTGSGVLRTGFVLQGNQMESVYTELLRTVRFVNLDSSVNTDSLTLSLRIQDTVNQHNGHLTQNVGLARLDFPTGSPRLYAGGHTRNFYVQLTESGQLAPIVSKDVQALLLPTRESSQIYVNITIVRECAGTDQLSMIGADSSLCFNFTQVSSTHAQLHISAPRCLTTTALRLLRYGCSATGSLASQPAIIETVLFYHAAGGTIVHSMPAMTNISAIGTVDGCIPNPCLNEAPCNSAGSFFTCSCPLGYTGSTCGVDINECAPTPCQNGATCNNLLNGYTCSCPTEFTGLHCENDLDQCRNSPCQNGGQCTDLFNDFHCTCAMGFTGRRCEDDLDECFSLPCMNNGVCINAANSFVCNCTAEFTGTRCETDRDQCRSNPCQHSGVCTDGFNSYTCDCVAGTTGINCEININDCLSDSCSNGQQCTDLIDGFSCQCAAGFTGTTCQTNIPECLSNPCGDFGSCNDHVNGYTCTCDPGYTGIRCNELINECSSLPCFNGATCNDLLNRFTCTCTPGWTGTRCNVDIEECAINNLACNSRGQCLNTMGSFTCTCQAGFTGTQCGVDINECDSGPCMNGGGCNNLVNGYTCTCAAGWTGVDCGIDIDECNSELCSSRGNCSNTAGSFTCACQTGFEGNVCQTNIQDCQANSCNFQGLCVDGINSFTCQCNPGRTGLRCEASVCDGVQCLNQGTPTVVTDTCTCSCLDRFFGSNCQTDRCAGITCQNQGVHAIVGGVCTCACPVGFTGNLCQVSSGRICPFTADASGNPHQLGNQTIVDQTLANCVEIAGPLEITCITTMGSVCTITSLAVLGSLRRVTGSLTIRAIGSLTTLAGLENLVHAERLVIQDMNALTTLEHLASNAVGCSVTFRELRIVGNNALTNLAGLDHVVQVAGANGTGTLDIQDNNALTSLQGLECLTQTGDLSLLNNHVLTDLNALSNLGNTMSLVVKGNNLLTNLNGLQSLRRASLINIVGTLTINVQGLHGLEARGNVFLLGTCYQSPPTAPDPTVNAEFFSSLTLIETGLGPDFNFIPPTPTDPILLCPAP